MLVKDFYSLMRAFDLSWHLKRLQNKQYYSFIRYGDGEWEALFRDSGDSHGHGKYKLTPKSKKAMNDALAKYYTEKDLFFGCQASRAKLMNQQSREFLKRHKLLKIKWLYGDVFHTPSKKGKLFPLIEELRKHKIIIIGPKFLRRSPEKLFKFVDFIQISERTGWSSKSTFNEVLLRKKKFGGGIVYSFSTGIGANILIPNLHRQMQGNFLIDFGSLWDPFCGRNSRLYMMDKHWLKHEFKKNLNLH